MSNCHGIVDLPEGPSPTEPVLRRPGYPEHVVAVQQAGHLSVEPVHDSGRYVIADGYVLFVTQEVNHAVALAQSGLPPSGTTVGYYTVRRPTSDDPWSFVSLNAWSIGGNRVAPSLETIDTAAQAFLASGYGDVRTALRRRS